MEFNKYQSTLEELHIDSYPQEVQNEFYEAINGVPYISNLISVNRPYVQDLPKDEKGRAIIDLSNPPIVKNTDYFRPTALHYQQYGCLTNLRPNANPNSEFGKWFYTELDRIWNGMTRPDGAWITGDMYFYLNYCPIIQSKIRKGTKVADRVVDLPEFWEGVDWRFKGIEKARNEGHHFAEIAKRGASKSYCVASILAKLFVVGENKENCQKVRALVMAYQKEYLTKDGTLNKFVDIKDFLTEQTQFPSRMLKRSLQEMQWKMGYIDVDTGIEKGTQNEVMGVSSKDDPDKARGKRASRIIIEEFGNFPKITDTYRVILPSVQEGDIVFGQIISIGTGGSEGADFAGAQEMIYNPLGYNILPLENVYDKGSQGKGTSIFFFGAPINRKGCYNHDGISDVTKAVLEICNNRYLVKYNSTDPMALTRTKAENPLTLQEAIMRRDSTLFPVASLLDRINQLKEDESIQASHYTGNLVMEQSGVVKFVPTADQPIRYFPHKDNKNCKGAVEIIKMPEKGIDGKVFSNRYYAGCLKKGQLVNTVEGLKKVEDITLQDKLINIDGEEVNIVNLQRHPNDRELINIKLSNILDGGIFTWNHPIYCCTPIRKYNGIKKVRTLGLPERYYLFDYKFRNAEDVKINDIVKSPNIYIKEKPFMHYWDNTNVRIDRQIPNPLDKEDFWWLIGLLLGDGWSASNGYTVHCSFNIKETQFQNKFEKVVYTLFNRHINNNQNLDTCIEKYFSCEQFNAFFATHFGRGVGNKHIPEWVKYIPANLKKQLIIGYLSADGNITKSICNIVSISKKLLCDIQDILFSLGIVSSLKVLRGEKTHTFIHSGKITTCFTQITYQLSIGQSFCQKMKQWSPEHLKLSKVTGQVEFNNHNNKNCWIDENNKYIYFKVKNITKEPIEDEVYNFECDTHTFMCNYIPTHNCDPYDDDTSETVSLGSIFILDLWTDSIVAEYTGRPTFADEYFETCRLLLIFYNARMNYENNKKGLFAYFSRMNCLYLLTDTLEFLKDKDMVKGGQIGNKLKGTQATEGINVYARTLIRNWLIKETPKIVMEDNNEKEITVFNLFNIENIALLMELSQWNPDGNYDRVSALGMLMLLREDKLITYNGDLQGSKRIPKHDYDDEDSFFTKNYNEHYDSVEKQQSDY